MFEELLNKKVKIVYDHLGKEKAVFGTLIGEDEKTFKLKFASGDIIGINKAFFVRISEERE